MLKPLIIVIAGPSACGKTSLITWLRSRYPNLISTLPVDNYYYALDNIPLDDRHSVNFDHPKSIEWSLLETHIQQLLKAQSIQCPRYCYITQTRISPSITVTPTPIILIDGILSLAIPEIKKLADIALYIDTPIDICLARKIKRDIAERGRTIEQSIQQYLHMTRPMYYQFILPSREQADLIIPHSNSIEKSCKLLEQYLQAELSELQ